MSTATLDPTTTCRPRTEVVEEHLPELLAAYAIRDDLRRDQRPFVELVTASDRLVRAREAVRGC